jgi:ABC-type microcin C transport system permease subunit YejB
LLRYTLLRILGAIPTLLLVIALAFLMVHAAPGGPFDDERVLPADVEANIAAAYHLDDPLPKQFARYLGGLLKGDLGPSYRYRDYTVAELIGSAFPLSLKLGAMGRHRGHRGGVAPGQPDRPGCHGFLDDGHLDSGLRYCAGFGVAVCGKAAVAARWLERC